MTEDYVNIPSRCDTPVPIARNDIQSLLNDSSDMDVIDDDLNKNKKEQSRAEKREREESTEEEEGWKEVKATKKKTRHDSRNSAKEEKNEIYVSHKERLPKQFAMARILKENNITAIREVKYISPFKIRFAFDTELAAQNFFMCEKLLERGWRFQKAMELSICYGVIKDVDLEFSEDEILKNISCQAPAKLLSLKRLDRRNRAEGGWCPSETLRLCFEGDNLPTSVRVFDMNIKVLPYIHQVSQCSQCWRMGHVRKMCPSKNVICPKCGGHHENCDTSMFCCVNCKGNHISLSKSCPVYKKERRLREIMSEFGCTYRKALECYVPPENQTPSVANFRPQASVSLENRFSSTPFEDIPVNPRKPTFAEIIKTKAIIHAKQSPNPMTKDNVSSMPKTQAQKNKKKPPKEDWMFWHADADDKDDHQLPVEEEENDERPSFKELLSRLKEVIYLNNVSFSYKIKCIFQLCLEWLTLVSVSFVSEWSWANALFNFFLSRNG